MGLPVPNKVYAGGFLAQLAHCARNSDILVHDAQFLEYEMIGRYHWGHSTVEDALEMAQMAGAKQLALFHYAPEHSDMMVDKQLALAQDLSRWNDFEVIAAAEGRQVDLGSISFK
jgi:ribonuclease BN (tRNA processing enzyme)